MILLAATILFGHLPARSQNRTDAITLEDFGLTHLVGAGARPASLAGAYVAMAGDVYSLVYNPSGLARLVRREIAFSMQHERQNTNNRYYDKDADVGLSGTTLDVAVAALPLPTYRGSFVIAAGVDRMMTSDIDLVNEGRNLDTDTDDIYVLEQTGSTYRYSLGFAGDLSVWVSAGANIFVLDGTIDKLTQYSFEFVNPAGPGSIDTGALKEDLDADLDGIGGLVGFQVHAHPRLRLGITVASPVAIRIEGQRRREFAAYYVNSPDTFKVESQDVDIDYTLPFRFDVGVALLLGRLTITTALSYSDWTQVKVYDRSIKDLRLQPIYRETLSWQSGLEVRIPRVPVRVAGGYAYLPYPLEYLYTDRLAEGKQPFVFGLDPVERVKQADTSHERHLFALGIGAVIGNGISLDTTYEYVTGERTLPSLTDTRSAHRLRLSGAFRF